MASDWRYDGVEPLLCTGLAVACTLILIVKIWPWDKHDSGRRLPVAAQTALRKPPRSMYTPYTHPKGVMNLRALHEDTGGMLFDIDNLYLSHLELKRTLLNLATSKVFGVHAPLAAPSLRAATEALELIASRLQTDYPGLVEKRGSLLVNIATGRYWDMSEPHSANGELSQTHHPLRVAAELVQEDLVIMLPVAGDGGYVLAAAAVCFADQWVLSEKLGLPLAAIHAPAAHYARISPAVDAFFRGLQPGGEKVRYNFTFCERPDLHIEGAPKPSDCPLPATSLPHSLYVRVERQVLLRLPHSGGVLFTIRTYQQDVGTFARHHRSELLAALDPNSRSTPLSGHQKEAFRERVRDILLGRGGGGGSSGGGGGDGGGSSGGPTSS